MTYVMNLCTVFGLHIRLQHWTYWTLLDMASLQKKISQDADSTKWSFTSTILPVIRSLLHPAMRGCIALDLSVIFLMFFYIPWKWYVLHLFCLFLTSCHAMHTRMYCIRRVCLFFLFVCLFVCPPRFLCNCWRYWHKTKKRTYSQCPGLKITMFKNRS